MNKGLFLVLWGMLLVSCGNLSKSEINKEFASGVVLIKTSSYYSAEMENGNVFYFTGVSEDKKLQNLTFDINEVEPSISFGTGFFVSDKGLIATNKHVVSSPVSRKVAKGGIKQQIQAYKNYIADEYQKCSQKKLQLEKIIQRKYAAGMDFSSEREEYDACAENMKEWEQVYEFFSGMDFSNLEVEEHQSVSVAFNDTHVTNWNDFESCVIRKQSKDADLAIIQLKSKKTPEGRHVFKIPAEDPLENYSLGEKIANMFGSDKNEELYMIGFNSGIMLAMKEDGIKSQITSGSISQNNKDDVMYTISAMHGSSGSPVVNGKGELVCVNYAGIDVTQNFNYGIKVKKLKEMFK